MLGRVRGICGSSLNESEFVPTHGSEVRTHSALEVDLETLKDCVMKSTIEEQRAVNKVIEKKLRWENELQPIVFF